MILWKIILKLFHIHLQSINPQSDELKKPLLREQFFPLRGEEFFDLVLIKADDDIVADADHGDPQLAGHIDHFLSFLEVARDIMLGVCDILFGKEILSHVAVMAAWRAVNGDIFHSLFTIG